MTHVVVVLLAVMLGATPLSAQRAADQRLGAAYPSAHPSASVAAREEAGWGGMQPWARHAIVGGVIGGIGGWLLSGLPCENAAGSCRSATTSIVAGAAIGTVVGLLWSLGRQY